MAEISLDKRWNGPWAYFETYLLEPENAHVGWVQWTGKQTFILQKNPLSKSPRSWHVYIAPLEIANILPENTLIRITDGKEYKDVEFKGKSVHGEYKLYYVVEKFELVDIEDFPKPYLWGHELEGFPTSRHERVKEFLYRLTQNFRHVENELFQKEMAYNILSCQRNFYGTGGIGTESFILGGKKQKMKNFIISTKKLLPRELKKPNNYYQYTILQNNIDIGITKKRRLNQNINELSYNDVSKINPMKKISNIQIQIPLIIPADADYKSQNFFDPDIMDYHLHALLYKPKIRQKDIKKFTDVAIKTSQYIGKEYTEATLMVDSLSLLKIASSMCRLQFTNELTEDIIPNVKDELYTMFKEYADIREEFSIGGITTHWSSLSEPARLVYGELLNISKQNKEIGLGERISLDAIKPKFNQYSLDRALSELNEYGFIIQHMNFAEITILDHS